MSVGIRRESTGQHSILNGCSHVELILRNGFFLSLNNIKNAVDQKKRCHINRAKQRETINEYGYDTNTDRYKRIYEQSKDLITFKFFPGNNNENKSENSYCKRIDIRNRKCRTPVIDTVCINGKQISEEYVEQPYKNRNAKADPESNVVLVAPILLNVKESKYITPEKINYYRSNTIKNSIGSNTQYP